MRTFFQKGFSLSGFAYDSAALDYLIKCSAGYPYTLHYLGGEVCELAEARPNRTISTEVVRAAMPMARNNFSRKSKISYRGRSELEFELLLRMTYSWHDGMSPDTIFRSEKFGVDFESVNSVKEVLSSVRDEGLLAQTQDTGAYVFVDPYLRVKIMIDWEAKLIRNQRSYPFGGQFELALQ
ncbi:MAG: hypothetical protein AAF830_05375 [Pseudomonadota bacterium]